MRAKGAAAPEGAAASVFLQPAGRFAGGTALRGWKLCEDFAPQDGDTRLSGEWGAKSGGRRAAGRVKTGVGNVKILLPGTKPQGLAGNGEQRDRPICRRNCA